MLISKNDVLTVTFFILCVACVCGVFSSFSGVFSPILFVCSAIGSCVFGFFFDKYSKLTNIKRGKLKIKK